MTAESELRQALAAEAESMKWSLSLHDVTTGEVVDNVVSLDDVRRRRTPLVLGAAAAIVALIGGGSYVATHRTSKEGRVLAGGPAASKVANSPAAATSSDSGGFVGGVPGGPVSLAGMTLVLPKDLPQNFRLQNAWAMPVGASNGAPLGLSSHLLILKGATAADVMTVTATKFAGGGTVGVTGPGPGRVVKVHGVDAQLVDAGSVRLLNWFEGGVQYAVSAASSIPESSVVELAESVVPGGSAAFAATALAGYTVSYDGDGNIQPAWTYNLQYSRENLNKPSDDSIGIDVRPAGSEQLDALQSLGMIGMTSKSLKVGGLDATLTTMEPGAYAANSQVPSLGSTSLMWKTADGLIVTLNSQGLSDAELISFAESITTVDEATFRTAVGDRLQSNGGYVGPDFTVSGVITFAGTTDGHAWTIKVTPPGADSLNANCIQFGFEGSGDTEGSCMTGLTDDQLLRESSTGASGLGFSYGVVSDKVRKVVVRDADSNKDIVSVETIAGTGGDDRRAYVVALKPLSKDVKNFIVVGLDEDGQIVGAPWPQPAGAYPGNLGDPSMPGTPATSAAPATNYLPGAPPAPDANDPTKLPVFATGTFEGRPWELRKPSGLTSDGPTCWFFSFAAGASQMTCEGTADPKMNLAMAHDRRTFVLASTAADITKVKASFKDGRVEDVVLTTKGTDRVAVIGVGLNDVLISVTAVNADGTDTTTVTGTLPGDPSLPFSFGGETGSNGSFSRSVATTIAPAATTVAPTTVVP
jgi:hypothetical protein